MQWKRNAWAVANINLFGPGLATIEIGFAIVLNPCVHFLQKVQLLVTVIDYDRVGGNEPIGQVLLGAEQKGLELKHWSEMLETPRRPVAQWHSLKPIK